MEEEIKKRLMEALKGLTPYQIAKDLNMYDAKGKPAASGPRNWVNGVNLPRPSTMLEICKLYGKNYDWVMTGVGEINVNKLTPNVKSITEKPKEATGKHPAIITLELQVKDLNEKIVGLENKIRDLTNDNKTLKIENAGMKKTIETLTDDKAKLFKLAMGK